MTQNSVYLLIDAVAILAVAVMLYLTEKPMTKPDTPTMEQRIYAMLDDAIQNGYDMEGWTVDDIVADLLAFADLNDDETEDAIRPHVITWKANRSMAT